MKPSQILCPECKKLGTTAIATITGQSGTLMGYSFFWDKEGRPHIHDDNFYNDTYLCFRGHEGKISGQGRPCSTCGIMWIEKEDNPYIFPDRPAVKSSTSVLQASVCQSCGCKLDGKTLKKVCNCRCHTEGPR